MVGRPRLTPGSFGVRPASQASPARVRRWLIGSPSALRWCGAAYVITVSTTSPGRGAVPPHVEYELTEEGRSLAPVLQALYDWGVARAERTGDTFR